jgi:conjugal transfer mating pair stabilization protein TraG
MEYPIYTYGGGDLLISVFNAVAMIFKSDNTYLTPVGIAAMTLGGVYIGVKAIFQGDIALIGRNWMIPSAIVFLFLFSAKTTVWIKDEVSLNAPIKIDNIPLGISFFTSLSSVISHHLSKLVEETMLPVSTNSSTRTGILYGAKAVAKLRDVQLQDPVLLQNTKEYLRQCYMKPYVMGNFGNNKLNAIKATDILSFLEANPAKCFGIKPIGSSGLPGKFMTCAEAGTMIKRQIEAHSRDPNILSKFGAALGLSTSDRSLMTRRIKAMTSDTLSYLDQTQQDVHEWMKQAMVLNANRESYDDWRQKVGHSRVFPELIKMQATRGMFQQSLGSIVGAEMAESMIPAASQPVMLALVVMVFVIILPFSLLPGGWQYIVTGLKLMIWVCSWPLFYTVIHAIVMIQIKDAVGGWGEDGLSLVGQGGFTELILWKYSAAQSLITSVPIISFAVVFGSPYALSSIAGSVASTVNSAGIGSSMADGNISMAQRSYNTLTRGQENYAPTLTMGDGIIDDGAMRVQSDNSGGQIITEHLDNLATNYNTSDMTSNSLSTNLSNAKSDMASLSERESKQTAIVSSQNLDVARSIAHGTTTAENLTVSDVEALKTGFSLDKSTSKSDGTSESKTTGTNAHLDLKASGVISAITGVGGGTSTTASNSKDVREYLSVQERQAFNTAIDKVKTAGKTDSLTSSNSEDIRQNESFSSNLSKQEQIASEKAKTQQEIDTLSSQISYVEQNSGTINRNSNDKVMRETMRQHPELRSKEQVARWQKSHSAEADAIALPIISSYNPFTSSSNSFDSTHASSRAQELSRNTPSTQNTVIATEDSLKNKHQATIRETKEHAVYKDDTGQQKPLEQTVISSAQNSNLRYNKDSTTILNDNLSPNEKLAMAEIDKGQKNYNETQAKVKKVKENTYDSTMVRVVENIGNDSTKLINTVTGENKNDKNNKKE